MSGSDSRRRPSGLPAGKLPPDVIARLLRERIPALEEVVGPGVGRDGAVLRIPGGEGKPESFLVAASDPITFTADRIGWYAVHVNANDVACMGADPAWFLATLLLPEGSGEEEVASVFDDVRHACAEVGAALVGGHTEVTPGLDRPILAGTMLGVTDRWVSAEGARPGDVLLLTKGIAVEGTAILATDAGARLEGALPEGLLRRARGFLREPGLSVVPDARAVLAAGRVHALHDPTEGGLATGVRELCEASGTGARLDLGRIPVFEETRRIAEALQVDPLGLLASGALLVVAPEAEAQRIPSGLEREGIPCVRIGRLTQPEEGVVAVDPAGGTGPFPRFERDELARVL